MINYVRGGQIKTEENTKEIIDIKLGFQYGLYLASFVGEMMMLNVIWGNGSIILVIYGITAFIVIFFLENKLSILFLSYYPCFITFVTVI
jgi:hypothetical protein